MALMFPVHPTRPLQVGAVALFADRLPVRGSARQRRARTGRRASLRRSAGTPTPFRCSVSWPVAELTPLPSVRYVQTGGDKSVYEARSARGPRALCSSAPQRRPPTCPSAPLRKRCRCSTGEPTRSRCGSGLLVFVANPPPVAARQAVPGRGDFWGGEERRPEVGARSALRRLTRRRCLNAALRSKRSEFGDATSGRAPQRSRCTHRPLQHEPLSGAAWCDSQAPRKIGPLRTAASDSAGESGATIC